METPKGMKYIDVTYTAARIDYERGDGVFTGEAGMRLLVAEDVAAWLVEGGEIAADYRGHIEEIVAHREMLCHGRYMDGSVSVEIVDDDAEA